MGKRTEKPQACPYNSRLQKGGALLEDMRVLVCHWQDNDVAGQVNSGVFENLLGKRTRSRTMDIFKVLFVPRFVKGSPPNAWKIVRPLEEHSVSLEILRPIYYWITARNERLLYDFVCNELMNRDQGQKQIINKKSVVRWLNTVLASCGKRWSKSVTDRVASGILAALRDFGILNGAYHKKVAPIYLPVESFAYIAYAIYHEEGVSGSALVSHPDWSLFLIDKLIVERMFLEADRYGLLQYSAAGKIVRIDFPARNFEEMANVVATRAY